ncbi:MAG TPA: Fe-S cluster assembly protein SufD, partial [Microbacterium sp.]|nr:Fe-S cluster assembly protein SufD [Microbacterium sp.]
MTTATQTPAHTGAEGHLDPAAQLASAAAKTASAGFVPVQTRSERLTSFDPAAFGIPTGREVNWKHTPLDALRPLLVDEAAPHGVISVDVTAPEGVEQRRLAPGEAPRGEVFRPDDVIAAVAWSQEAEAPLIRIPAGVELDEPIVVRLTGTGGVAHAHVVIEAQANARGTIVL